jgi:hypothetical protein
LLGDIVELRQAPVHEALAQALPVFAQLGEALGPEGEVVIVPGNHDHHLLSGWFERATRENDPPALGLEREIDWSPGETLSELAQALAPARVRASYPGVWLREGLYATHGHYLDRHTTVPMLERLGAGAMARIVGEPASSHWRAEDYEKILAPIYAWIHAMAQRSDRGVSSSSHGVSTQAWRTIRSAQRGRRLRGAATAAAFGGVIGALGRTSLGPLRSDLSSGELRRAALRAFSEVVARLGIDAEHVIFGHTHRAGPLAGDEHGEWIAPGGARIMNTGCWVVEPVASGPGHVSPYQPGFCAIVDGEKPPSLHNLMHGARPTQA